MRLVREGDERQTEEAEGEVDQGELPTEGEPDEWCRGGEDDRGEQKSTAAVAESALCGGVEEGKREGDRLSSGGVCESNASSGSSQARFVRLT